MTTKPLTISELKRRLKRDEKILKLAKQNLSAVEVAEELKKYNVTRDTVAHVCKVNKVKVLVRKRTNSNDSEKLRNYLEKEKTDKQIARKLKINESQVKSFRKNHNLLRKEEMINSRGPRVITTKRINQIPVFKSKRYTIQEVADFWNVKIKTAQSIIRRWELHTGDKYEYEF